MGMAGGQVGSSVTQLTCASLSGSRGPTRKGCDAFRPGGAATAPLQARGPRLLATLLLRVLPGPYTTPAPK